MIPGRLQSWRFATVSKQASSEESLGTDMFECRPEGVIVGHLKPGISDGEKGGPAVARWQATAHSPSPNGGDQALRHGHILLVLLPKFLEHHPLLGSDTESDEESRRDAGGQARHVVGENERLAHGI